MSSSEQVPSPSYFPYGKAIMSFLEEACSLVVSFQLKLLGTVEKAIQVLSGALKFGHCHLASLSTQ